MFRHSYRSPHAAPFRRVALLVGSFALLASISCSSNATDEPTPGFGPSPGAPGGNQPPGTGNTDIIGGGFTPAPGTPPGTPGSTDVPVVPGLGGETLCDDKDDNGNGIIDDVDVGKDGLCDCIRIGFFGEVASDAGTATDSFEAWLIARSGQVPIQHLDATGTLTAEWLSNLQVLIVGGLKDRRAQTGSNPAFSAAELAAFDDWIQNRGGGVITLSGYTASIDDARPVSELLQNTGLRYDLTSVTGAGVIDENGPPVWLSEIVTPSHPIVEGVKEIGVYYGYPVTGDGTAILEGEGYTLGVAKEWASGRVFAFADEWITQDATWAGLRNGQQNPCQQPCNEQENICRIASEQCEQCALQPCSDPNETDLETCSKGCQPSCESETQRCETNTQLCKTCSDEVIDREEATPRLWLNTIRWLTPANECKVDIPPRGGVRVR